MKKYILCDIHPFVLNQRIEVHDENNKCVFEASSMLPDLQKTIYVLCKEYDIHDVVFHGKSFYDNRIKDHFTSIKYAKHPIKVYLEGEDTSEVFN